MKKDSADDEIILFCLYSLLLSCPVLSVEIPITDSLCQMIGVSWSSIDYYGNWKAVLLADLESGNAGFVQL